MATVPGGRFGPGAGFGDIVSSTITATPVGSSSPVLAGSGSPTSGVVTGVAPLTTYSITVANRDAGGPGALSAPVSFTSGPARVLPGAPMITYHWWASAYMALSWSAATPGDSPIDQYEISSTSDGEVPTSATDYAPASALTDYLTVDQTVDWSTVVRAHNVAGWGPWSAAASYPALGG